MGHPFGLLWSLYGSAIGHSLAQLGEVFRSKGSKEDLFEIFYKDDGKTSCKIKKGLRTFVMLQKGYSWPVSLL